MTQVLRGVGWSLLGDAVLFCGAAIYNRRHNEHRLYDNLNNQVSNGAEAITLLLFTVAVALFITGAVLLRTAATTQTAGQATNA